MHRDSAPTCHDESEETASPRANRPGNLGRTDCGAD